MICISNLNKIYQTRKGSHHALRDVNLTLPDRGHVFVLGKSGSGKSTFLNLIGGLDRASSGRIVVDGNDVFDYSERQFVDYRNGCIGFIFQDHHLIDDLTVYQNIKLALDLRRIEDDGAVSDALARVGLAGYEERYPRELSGGERQRVAIARAIVKRPRIILADEPTGNLDGKNAAEVMRILREMSTDCLVLTVSHDTAAVHANADRIIELSEGAIVSDVTKNPDYADRAVLQGETVCIPGDRMVSDEDVELINESLAGQRVKRFVLNRDKFVTTGEVQVSEKKIPFDRKRLKFGRVMALSFTFLKTKVGRIAGVAIPLALSLLVILVSQAYINFDGNRITADCMEKTGQDAIVLSKEISLDGINRNARRFPATVTAQDLEAFAATGFSGKTYPILSVSVPVTSYKNASGLKNTRFSYGVSATESLGTVVVDRAFMEEKLGKFELVAAARNEDPLGVYITDYLADMILTTNSKYKGKNYNSLLEYYTPDNSGIGGIYINGIIRTDYDERYAELIERVTVNKENDLVALFNDEQFQKLSSELYTFLGYSYTFNQNYVEDYCSEELGAYHTYAWSHKLVFNGKTEYSIPGGYVTHEPLTTLADGQVLMGHKTYNAIFGTNYGAGKPLEEFESHKVKLAQYAYYDTERADAYFDEEIEIVGLYSGDGMRVSRSVRGLFDRSHVRQTGIYFDGLDHLSDVLALGEERSFMQDSVMVEAILNLQRCVRLFVAVFQIVNIVLCASVVFIFVSFSTKMIRDKLHEIGILKALGTDRVTINVIFGLQIALIAIFTCVVSALGYYLLVKPANELFIISLREMVPSQLVLDLDVLIYIPRVVWENVILVAILAVVSLFVPMSKIGRIQPVKIINSRD